MSWRKIDYPAPCRGCERDRSAYRGAIVDSPIAYCPSAQARMSLNVNYIVSNRMKSLAQDTFSAATGFQELCACAEVRDMLTRMAPTAKSDNLCIFPPLTRLC